MLVNAHFLQHHTEAIQFTNNYCIWSPSCRSPE